MLTLFKNYFPKPINALAFRAAFNIINRVDISAWLQKNKGLSQDKMHDFHAIYHEITALPENSNNQEIELMALWDILQIAKNPNSNIDEYIAQHITRFTSKFSNGSILSDEDKVSLKNNTKIVLEALANYFKDKDNKDFIEVAEQALTIPFNVLNKCSLCSPTYHSKGMD